MSEYLPGHYRVENPGSLERCMGNTPVGQCTSHREPGSIYCKKHNISEYKNGNEPKLRNYRLEKWQGRVNEFADSDLIKSLREEIGILRMVLEEVINQCKDSTDLLLYSSKISELVVKIEHLVVSCHKIENNLGFLMDRTTVLNLSSQIVTIISKHINSEPTVAAIISDISEIMENQE